MSRIAKAPKVNESALLDAVLRYDKNYSVEWNLANGILIRTNHYSIDTDDILGLSFLLYGTHNQLECMVRDGSIALFGATYRLQPEFLIAGEEIEFEIADRSHES